MAISFRFASAGEYERLSRFLHDHWAEDHIYCRSKALFDWTFHRTTHWNPDQYSFALAESGSDLAGMLGGIPFTFNDRGRSTLGMWIVNYVLAPEYRKGTLALQLLSQFRKPDYEPVIAFGMNPATSVIYKVLRGELLPETPRHFMILEGAEDKFEHVMQIAQPEWDTHRIQSLASHFTVAVPDGNVDAGKVIPEAWDQVDWPIMAKVSIGAARNREFLQWRYLDHPLFDYRIVTIPEGDRTGVAVWRLETIRKKTEQGREDVEKIGRLVEFMAVSPSNAKALFGAFCRDLKRSGAFGADYYGFQGEARVWLEASGFKRTSQYEDGSGIPSRLQPLDGKSSTVLSAMFLKPEVPREWASDECPWYWTKADSDQDRPN